MAVRNGSEKDPMLYTIHPADKPQTAKRSGGEAVGKRKLRNQMHKQWSSSFVGMRWLSKREGGRDTTGRGELILLSLRQQGARLSK